MSKKEEFAEARPALRTRRPVVIGLTALPRITPNYGKLRQATPILILPHAGSTAIRFLPRINYQLPGLRNFSEGGLTAHCTKSHQIALNRSDFASHSINGDSAI
jgi:hypothetical protein